MKVVVLGEAYLWKDAGFDHRPGQKKVGLSSERIFYWSEMTGRNQMISKMELKRWIGTTRPEFVIHTIMQATSFLLSLWFVKQLPQGSSEVVARASTASQKLGETQAWTELLKAWTTKPWKQGILGSLRVLKKIGGQTMFHVIWCILHSCIPLNGCFQHCQVGFIESAILQGTESDICLFSSGFWKKKGVGDYPFHFQSWGHAPFPIPHLLTLMSSRGTTIFLICVKSP